MDALMLTALAIFPATLLLLALVGRAYRIADRRRELTGKRRRDDRVRWK